VLVVEAAARADEDLEQRPLALDVVGWFHCGLRS
jgi:hypothetical protein